MDFDLFTNIILKDNGTPKYRQLAEALKENILTSVLAPGDRLPSLNGFAEGLGINRLTAHRALDELEIEGWVDKREKSGTYVAEKLPEYAAEDLIGCVPKQGRKLPLPDPEVSMSTMDYRQLSFNDGYPDYRLFPDADVGRAYSTILKDYNSKEAFSYHDVFGHEALRDAISRYIHISRGISSGRENVIITRGSTMGIYLAARTICSPGETIAMGAPGYYLARECFLNQGLQVESVTVDHDGLNIEDLRRLLAKHKIKLVYITPHHHYPTTVTMPAERRLELLRLASEHGFYILEDDYDFNFQFDRSPILPIASIDQLQSVIYVGGFSKSLAPAIRTGFMMAAGHIIERAGMWRKLIDRMGDTIQELTYCRLLERGIIQGVIRRSRKLYEERRNLALGLIRSDLSHIFEPQDSSGGLAFWTRIAISPKEYDSYRQKAKAKGVYLMDPGRFGMEHGFHTRLGYASMNIEEIGMAVELLKEI